MSSIEIYNEDCFDTMNRLKEGGRQIDVVLTSPPYNTIGIEIDQQYYNIAKERIKG